MRLAELTWHYSKSVTAQAIEPPGICNLGAAVVGAVVGIPGRAYLELRAGDMPALAPGKARRPRPRSCPLHEGRCEGLRS